MFNSACVCNSMNPNTDLAGAAPSLISYEFSNQGTFLGPYLSSWQQKSCSKVNKSWQQKKSWDPPPALARDWRECHSMAQAQPWHTVANHDQVFKKWPLQPKSLTSSVQLAVLSPPLHPTMPAERNSSHILSLFGTKSGVVVKIHLYVFFKIRHQILYWIG